MKMFVTLPSNEIRDRFFPLTLAEKYTNYFEIEWNPENRQLSSAELAAKVEDVELLTIGWGCPRLDESVLKKAKKLKLVIHLGGSVAQYASEALYDVGIRIVSGNKIMAKFVAEAILSYILCGLRKITFFDRSLKNGANWPRNHSLVSSLFDKTVGFVGLGTVGLCLLDFLRPFGVKVKIFDPFISGKGLEDYPFAKIVGTLEQAIQSSDIISVHASLTKETKGMIGLEELRTVKDGALLINAARAAIIDRSSLIGELSTGRFRAVLDVFHDEPLPTDDPLRNFDNVILIPHMAGSACHAAIAPTLLEELVHSASGNFSNYEISREHFRKMTDNNL